MESQYSDTLPVTTVMGTTEYWVRFWSSPRVAGSMPSQETWRLTQVVDVAEVLRWVAERKNSRDYEIFAAASAGGDHERPDTALYRLSGSDPTESDGITVRASSGGPRD